MSSSSKVLLGVLAGAAAGALLGVLLAPDKGTVTRKKIAKLGEDYAGEITDKINDLREMFTDKLEALKGDGEELLERGKSALDDAKGQVKSAARSAGNYTGNLNS